MTTETTDGVTEDTADKIRAGLKGVEAETTDTDVDTDSVEETTETKTETKAKETKTPSDAEAKLLKELMKYKKAAKEASDKAKNLETKFDGLDADSIREMLAKQEEAENAALEKKGEYDRLLTKQKEAAEAKVKEANDKAKALEDEKAALLNKIEDLTTGQAFANSKFVADKLTLTPNKAKALYKSHFEFVDGKMVAYDKPKGEADRTPIVDDAGENVSFESAIEAIINADPDKDFLLKVDSKAGAGSKPTTVDARKKTNEYADTTDKIAAGIDAFLKAHNKK